MKTIKRFDCYLINKNGVVFSKITGKELKPFLRKGYLCVCLYNFGIKCTIYVHRLVAETYIDNPRNKPCIDHIDGNPFNNHVDNLRWVTHSENNNNPITKQRQSKSASKPMTGKFGANNHLSKAVLMLKNGVVIKEYQSINLAERDGFNNSLIVRCCKGLRKKHKGYEWDKMEFALQEKSFWYFLSNKDYRGDNHLEFIFEILAKKYEKHAPYLTDYKEDNLYTYLVFNELITKKILPENKSNTLQETREFLWEEIKKLYENPLDELKKLLE